MQTFMCPSCSNRVYFDNLVCNCGRNLVLGPAARRMENADTVAGCANRTAIGCNWAAEVPGGLCRSCILTDTRPDESVPGNRTLWAEAEASKRWVLFNLAAWRWFTADDPGMAPTFDLLAERTRTGRAQPIMGHENGHITINVAEADPTAIVQRREQMGEPYRTMTGHYRHEIAHFLFERLYVRPAFLDHFRALFGDERADYGTALAHHYDAGPSDDWPHVHISRYAASHPHEDWAETMAHALHLNDLVDSAVAVGLVEKRDDPEAISAGIDLALRLNHVNRSMGLDDAYPFVVPPLVRTKLSFAWHAVTGGPVPLT